MNPTQWTETVILADADYIDHVAFELTVNFERMLERRIAPADLAAWIEYAALDGGLRPDAHAAQQQVQAVFVHDKGKRQMTYFKPGDFADIDGKAFNGKLGEFLISCVTAEGMASKASLMADSLQVVAEAAEVKRIIVVPDAADGFNAIRQVVSRLAPDKLITVLDMEPRTAALRQEMLGYSIMAALGITAGEIDAKANRLDRTTS